MHLFRTLIFPVTVLATVFAADPAPPAVEVRARRLSINQSLEYEADGSVKSPNVSTGLELTLVPAADLIVVSIGDITVTEWVCDDGTVLTATVAQQAGASLAGPRMDAERRRALSRAGLARDGLPAKSLLHRNDLSVHIGSTQAPGGTAIARLSGTVTLQVGDGAVQEAVIKPAKAMVGKPVAVEGQPGLAIAIDAWTEDQITVSFPAALAERLQGIELRGAGGERIESNGFSGTGDGTRTVRTMRARVPADGAVAVRFIPKLKDVVVPFALTNLALPSAEAARKPAGKPATTPVGEPKGEGAPVKPVGGGGF